MQQELRKTGIRIIGDVPWGTHFCQFYKTKKDLLDILVPYFSTGLKNNEYCMWVTSDPLREEEARKAMKKALPEFEGYLERGQIEIIPHTKWYLKGGSFNSTKVLNGWVAKLNQALARGYEGLRLTGNTFWLEKKDWKRFTDYEEEINNVIGQYKMMAVCTYSLDRCNANEIVDVVRNHQFALIKRERKWELIESSERRRTQEAIRQSDLRMRQVLNNLFVFVGVLTPEGVLIEANRPPLEAAGIRFEDVYGKRCEDTYWFNHSPQVQHQLREAICRAAKGDPSRYDVDVRMKDGKLMTIDFMIAPMRDDQGRITYLVPSAVDITERKEVEEALRKSETKYRIIANNTYDWEFWLNPEGRFLYVSPSCKQVSGYDAEDFLKNPNLRQQIIHPDDRPLFDRHLQEVEKKSSGEAEFRIIGPDGSQRWISHVCQPIFDLDGVFLGTRGSNRDITDRKQSEEALQKSNKRFGLLSETANRLLASEAPQEIVNDLCAKVMANLDCHAFFNYLVDEEKHELHLNAFGGIPEEAARKIEWLEYGGAVCGCAARDACRIVCENIPQTPDPRTDLVKSFGIKAYACHPLFSQGRVIGTLSFGTRARSVFTEDELSMMKTVTDQVAIAMERVQHIHELKTAQEALRRSRDGLEIQVQERTSELQKANEELRAEVLERKRAEEKIREQADLLELTHDAIIVRDMNDRIVFWNRGAEETYGWAKEEAMGNVTHVFLRTQFPKPLSEITDDFLETGRWQGELVHSQRDGSHIIVESRQVLTRDKNGKPLGTLEINRDITMRKQAEEVSRTASLYTRSLIEASLDPLVTISPDGKVTDVNNATELVTGVPREQLIGSDFSDYFTEPERARAGYQKVFSEGSVTDYPLAIRHTSGRTTEVLYNATVYRNEAGGVQGVFAAARDITQLKKSEEAVRAASLYTRSLIEASLDPLVTISPDGKVTDVNNATELVTGVPREQLIGSDFSDYFTEPERARAGYQKVFSEGSVTDYPLAIRHTSGRTTDVLYNATVYRNEDGDAQGVFAAARDITQLKKSEEAVRAASLYTRSLIEASLDPLVTISADGKVMDVNKGTELVTGVPRENLIGSDFSDYFTEPERARAGYRKVFSEGSVTDYPLAIRHISGRTTEVLYNATVYRSEAGEVQGVFAAARDVTQLKRAEERLRTYMMKLEWSNRELQDFAFVASHDLQEPLRKIQAFGDQLKTKHKESLNDEGRDYLGRMQNAAHRMQTLIQALLNYSRVTTKAEPFSPVNLTRLIQEVVSDLEMRVEGTGGQVEVGEFPILEADPNQMRQLFQNLISNALKFRKEEKPAIKIYGLPFQSPEVNGASSSAGHYQIFVEDNGIGFDEKYLDRIFVPFQRLHGRDTYEGTGIGLAICRKIVERHGGSITAKSTPAKGSTFIITLPMKQPKGGDI